MGYVRFLSKQEIEDRKRHRAAQRDRARTLVAQHFDTWSGAGAVTYVDGDAMLATLSLWHEHGEGKVTLRQVKAERARIIERRERFFTEPVVRELKEAA